MEFNYEPYFRSLGELKAQLAADQDQGWRETVDLRYGQFLIRKCAGKLERAALVFGQPMPDPIAGSKAMAAQIWGVTGELSFAVALLAGQCSVKDAVESEAMMRLYYEAAKPKPASAEAT